MSNQNPQQPPYVDFEQGAPPVPGSGLRRLVNVGAAAALHALVVAINAIVNWIAAGMGGGSLISVATRADVSALATVSLVSGTTVRTTRVTASFQFDPASTLTVDGINVLTTLEGTGRWIRQQIAIWTWVTQPQVYIDYTAGNDENSGASGAPIKTFQEWFARGQGWFVLLQNLNLTGTAWPFTDRFHYSVRSIVPTGSSTGIFSVTGQRTVGRSGSCTSASTNPVVTLGAQQFATIIDSAVADWTTDVGKLIVAANGARAWILKDMAGGTHAARVTAWSTAAGATAAAPPNGTAYDVVSLTSFLPFPSITGAFDVFQIIDCEVGTTLRTLTSKTEWLGCKFNFGIDTAQQGVFANCLFNGATFNFSNANASGIVNPTCCIFGSCGFLNSDLVWSTGHMELEDCCFQAGHILAGRTPNGHSGLVGAATLAISGTYGVGLFDAGAGNAAVVLDGRSSAFIGESLFGRGNLGGGTVLRRQSAVFIKGLVPTLQCAAGVELSVPVDPIGPLALLQAGTGTLVGGVATVLATLTPQHRIVATRNSSIGTLGAGGLVIPDGTRIATSFDVKSVDLTGGTIVTDLSTFDWVALQPTTSPDCTTWANYAANFPTGMQTTKELCVIQGP